MSESDQNYSNLAEREKRLIRLFDQKAPDWNNVVSEYNYSVPGTLLSILKSLHLSPKRHLDLACANGHIGTHLDQNGFECERVGLDLSEKMVRIARKSGAYECVFQGNMENGLSGQIQGKFDLVTVLGVLEFLPDASRVLKDIHSFMNSDGIGVFTFRVGSPSSDGKPDLSPSNLNGGQSIESWHQDRSGVEEILISTGWKLIDLFSRTAYSRSKDTAYWFAVARSPGRVANE